MYEPCEASRSFDETEGPMNAAPIRLKFKIAKFVPKFCAPKVLLAYADESAGHPPNARPTKMSPSRINMYWEEIFSHNIII